MSSGTTDLAASAATLLDLAEALAGRFAETARSHTSVACQRAILRAIGVTGLAPNGRPLALEVVRRFSTANRRLLRGGIALPFALAAHEYDLEPQQLALEVAQGHVDLAAEAGLLRERSRSGPARALLDRWLESADDRFEANRVARAELAELFGAPPSPSVAVELRAFDAREAAADAAALVGAGAHLVRVRVPRDGELRDDLGGVAAEVEWPVGPDAPPPAGSQRGLALLRAALDEAGARHGGYAWLAARRVGLAAPELAVVAGFERVDAVFVDPLEAIAEFAVDPARAFVDHALAQALLLRSGARLVLGPGPLVAPEAPHAPDEVTAASGGALALQALSRAFALRNGWSVDRLDLGALPAFIPPREQATRGLLEVGLRSILFPGHRLVIDVHVAEAAGAALPALLGAWLAQGDQIGAVFVPHAAAEVGRAREGLRGASLVADAFASARAVGAYQGTALECASAALEHAVGVLRTVEHVGLAALFGPREWLGAEGMETWGSGDPAGAWAWRVEPGMGPSSGGRAVDSCDGGGCA